jgi:hypothetical protein
VVLVLAAPFLFWLARWLWRPNVEDEPWRVRLLAVGGTTLGLLALLAVGLFWDVYLIGQRAKVLCQETGLVVEQTVPPAGILGLTSINSYRSIGVPFLESEHQGRKFRHVTDEGGTKTFEVDELISEYQLLRSSEVSPAKHTLVDGNFLHHLERLVDRRTGRLIGQLRTTAIDAGWFDLMVFGLTGFSYTPWICGKTPEGEVVFGTRRMTHRDLLLLAIRAPTNPGTDENGHRDLLQDFLVR